MHEGENDERGHEGPRTPRPDHRAERISIGVQGITHVRRVERRRSHSENIEQWQGVEVDQDGVGPDVTHRLRHPTGRGHGESVVGTTLPDALTNAAHDVDRRGDDEKTRSIRPEGGGRANRDHEDPGQGRAKRARDLEAHHAERDCLANVFRSHKVTGVRLKRRGIEGGHGASEHRQGIEVPRLDSVVLDEHCQRGGKEGKGHLRHDEDESAVESVGNRACDRTEDDHRDDPERGDRTERGG